jgi:hypothetical protein
MAVSNKEAAWQARHKELRDDATTAGGQCAFAIGMTWFLAEKPVSWAFASIVTIGACGRALYRQHCVDQHYSKDLPRVYEGHHPDKSSQ